MRDSQEQFKQALGMLHKVNARYYLHWFFFFSQIYGLFPSVYNSGYPRQVSEDDHSCGFPNSDEPDVFTAFKVKMVDFVAWYNSWIEGIVAPQLYQDPRNVIKDSIGNRFGIGPDNSLVLWISDLKLLTKEKLLCGYCTSVVFFRMPSIIGYFNWILHVIFNLCITSNLGCPKLIW